MGIQSGNIDAAKGYRNLGEQVMPDGEQKAQGVVVHGDDDIRLFLLVFYGQRRPGGGKGPGRRDAFGIHIVVVQGQQIPGCVEDAPVDVGGPGIPRVVGMDDQRPVLGGPGRRDGNGQQEEKERRS